MDSSTYLHFSLSLLSVSIFHVSGLDELVLTECALGTFDDFQITVSSPTQQSDVDFTIVAYMSGNLFILSLSLSLTAPVVTAAVMNRASKVSLKADGEFAYFQIPAITSSTPSYLSFTLTFRHDE